MYIQLLSQILIMFNCSKHLLSPKTHFKIKNLSFFTLPLFGSLDIDDLVCNVLCP